MADWRTLLAHNPPLTGDLAADVPHFLHHHGLPRVAEHVTRVAAEARRIALRAGVSPDQAATAAWLHDISAPIRNSLRIESSHAMGLEILPEEAQVPMLLHQKQSVVIARELFGVSDAAVLDAIGCHTTLRRFATLLDKVLFVADKLAWDQGGEPPYKESVTAALDLGLDEAVRTLLEWIYQDRASLKIVHPWLKGAFLDATGLAWGLSIRPVTEPDYDAVVTVADAIYPEPSDPVEMRERDQSLFADPDYGLRRMVAICEDGRLAGYAVVNTRLSVDKHEWYAWVGVHPDCRGQGVGTSLWRWLEGYLRQQGAVKINSRVMGGHDDAFAWAQRRGYSLDRQRTESVLDLTTWDGARFAGHLDRVRAGGLDLRTLREIPEAMLREVWDCDVETTRDHPEYDGVDVAFDDWVKTHYNEKKPRVYALALDGERVAGYSFISLPTVAGEGAYTMYTCVRRAYRGRGVAVAVKLLTIEAALSEGVKHMRTNNNPENGPMLAVNEKLGYVMLPGPRTLVKQLC